MLNIILNILNLANQGCTLQTPSNAPQQFVIGTAFAPGPKLLFH